MDNLWTTVREIYLDQDLEMAYNPRMPIHQKRWEKPATTKKGAELACSKALPEQLPLPFCVPLPFAGHLPGIADNVSTA